MKKLTREDLLSLEDYTEQRESFRREVMEHRRERRVGVGPHVSLLFEDRKTILYQAQEMLRAEKIFEKEGIEAELATYNPLIPDGKNLKATMMIEYEDVAERRAALKRLGGVEHKVWIASAGSDRCRAIADEDLERSTGERTSAVHFLRFEPDRALREAFRNGGAIALGVDHANYHETLDPLPAELARQLSRDFDPES
ncbi:MAG: DUF3501 family protein [Gammaproteobacteria bacterium]|nr:DUF3501 family protein [Gammaproteobacteria bacterium]